MTPLYLNHAFAKRPHREVVEAMMPYFRAEFENPLTESDNADRIREAIENSRKSIASLLNALPQEIFFVSSGTEANNWALKGITSACKKKKRHLVISGIEHFSVYQTAEYLIREGWELSVVPVHSDGTVDMKALQTEIGPETALVSIQAASDEIGVIQDLEQVIALKKTFDDVLFHTDAVQYLCYEPLDSRTLPFDLISFNSNALYGPAGIGALFIRKGTRIVPLLHGGTQEEGLRAGMQATGLIAGFGVAARTLLLNQNRWKDHLKAMQTFLFDAIAFPGLNFTGSKVRRTVDNVHVTTDVDGEAVLALLQAEGITASSGSTCSRFVQKQSHVLKALGLSSRQARGALLFTLGIENTQEQLADFARILDGTLQHLRSIKPD